MIYRLYLEISKISRRGPLLFPTTPLPQGPEGTPSGLRLFLLFFLTNTLLMWYILQIVISSEPSPHCRRSTNVMPSDDDDADLPPREIPDSFSEVRSLTIWDDNLGCLRGHAWVETPPVFMRSALGAGDHRSPAPNSPIVQWKDTALRTQQSRFESLWGYQTLTRRKPTLRRIRDGRLARLRNTA